MDANGSVKSEWPDETRRRHILIVTLLALAMACIVVMLHEYAHAVAQLLFGAGSSSIRALSADAGGHLSVTAQGWTAAAGPLFSLVSGALVWVLARKLRGAAFQMAFWFYIASLQNAAGYLVITPFGVGDTAVVVDRWGVPSWGQFVLAGLGVVMMFVLAALASVDVQARFHTVRGLRMAVMWPVLWASLSLILLSLLFGLVAGYEAPALLAMVMSMATMYVAALMSSIFWGRFPFHAWDISPGPLWWAILLAVLAVGAWIFHGVVGVTLG